MVGEVVAPFQGLVQRYRQSSTATLKRRFYKPPRLRGLSYCSYTPVGKAIGDGYFKG